MGRIRQTIGRNDSIPAHPKVKISPTVRETRDVQGVNGSFPNCSYCRDNNLQKFVNEAFVKKGTG